MNDPFPGLTIEQCLDKLEKAEEENRDFYQMLILRWIIDRLKTPVDFQAENQRLNAIVDKWGIELTQWFEATGEGSPREAKASINRLRHEIKELRAQVRGRGEPS